MVNSAHIIHYSGYTLYSHLQAILEAITQLSIANCSPVVKNLIANANFGVRVVL